MDVRSYCKFILQVISVLLTGAGDLFSQDSSRVNITAARLAAKTYLLRTVPEYSGTSGRELILDHEETRTSSINILYYVFNINRREGFIVISADINTTPVLCYVPEGSYSIFRDSRTPGLYDCLESFAYQIDYSLNHKVLNARCSDQWKEYVSGLPEKTESLTLKMNSRWNQTAGYNLYSPGTGIDGHPVSGSVYGGRTPAGCVATAMGQIMYYYQWPPKVKGSRNYNDPHNPNENSDCGVKDPTYGNIKFIEPQSEFDYSLMTDKAHSSNIHISRLLYNCGVSVNMDFAFCQSWTNTHHVPQALKDHFDYHDDVKYILRSDFSHNEWLNIIRDQIRKERPVQYRGKVLSGGVGHSWLCYGYKTVAGEVQLLFNFGWGGTGDGFFSLPEMTDKGYSFENGAVIDIYPVSQPDLTVSALSLTREKPGTGQPFDLRFSVSNMGTRAAGPDTVRCWLSADRVIDTNDTILATVRIGPLPAGKSRDMTVENLHADIKAQGQYFIIAEADAEHDVHESDETNNVGWLPVQFSVKTSGDLSGKGIITLKTMPVIPE
jgi:hypothetical protein